MLFRIPNILNDQQLQQCRDLLEQATWSDGRITAGIQAAQVKNNQQFPEELPQAQALRQLVVEALSKSAVFFSAALPKRIYPSLFN